MNQRHGALAAPLVLLALVGYAGGGSATPTPTPSLATVKCTAIHKAPLRTACGTEASNWPGASVYGVAELGVKDGYNSL